VRGVAEGGRGEVTPREGLQAGLASNSPRQEVSILTPARVNEDEGHLFTGAANVVHRVGVLCVNNGEGRERRRCLADADDNRAMVVELDPPCRKPAGLPAPCART